MMSAMKSWRMTLSGGVSSAASLVLALSAGGVAIPKWLVVTAGFTVAGGFMALGINGKDAAVHSTPAEVRAAGIAENPTPAQSPMEPMR